MRKLNFTPKLEFPAGKNEDVVLTAIVRELEKGLKSKRKVVKALSAFNNGEPYGLIALRDGANPQKVYEEDYVHINVHGSTKEVTIYYCSPKEIDRRTWH